VVVVIHQHNLAPFRLLWALLLLLLPLGEEHLHLLHELSPAGLHTTSEAVSVVSRGGTQQPPHLARQHASCLTCHASVLKLLAQLAGCCVVCASSSSSRHTWCATTAQRVQGQACVS
jgi:hypothetical protein